jgi:hypothetical protein
VERTGTYFRRGYLPRCDVGEVAYTARWYKLHTLQTAQGISRMESLGVLGRKALVRTDVSEERSVSIIIKVTRIGELRKTLAVGRYVPPKRRFLQEPHGVTFQKTAFFIVTAVKISHLTGHFDRPTQRFVPKSTDINLNQPSPDFTPRTCTRRDVTNQTHTIEWFMSRHYVHRYTRITLRD